MGTLLLRIERLWGEQVHSVGESGCWNTWIQPFPLKILLCNFLSDFSTSWHCSRLRFSSNEAALIKRVVGLNTFGVLVSHGNMVTSRL